MKLLEYTAPLLFLGFALLSGYVKADWDDEDDNKQPDEFIEDLDIAEGFNYVQNSNNLNSHMIILEHIEIVKVYYGFENKYVPFEIGVDDEIFYDFNEGLPELKEFKNENCGCEGGLYSLNMKYTGQNPVTIQVKEKKGNKQTFFKQSVNLNEEFTFTRLGKEGKMDKTIYFYAQGKKMPQCTQAVR